MGASGPTSGRGKRAPAAKRTSATARRDAARRPADRRRTAGTTLPAETTAARPTRSRHGLTTRAAFLGLLVCALTLALTVPLREYFQQRGRVADLRARTAEQDKRVETLEERKRRLDDPAYVERLARERLHYVRPGETGYIVIAPTPTPSPGPAGVVAGTSASDEAWYAQLWSTVEGAGAVPKASASTIPSPAASPAK
jgi:cell division protein FtsB